MTVPYETQSIKSLEEIQDIICDRHGVTPENLKSDRRARHLVDARVDFSVMARLQSYSYPKIGAFLNRDHSTIQHQVKVLGGMR